MLRKKAEGKIRKKGPEKSKAVKSAKASKIPPYKPISIDPPNKFQYSYSKNESLTTAQADQMFKDTRNFTLQVVSGYSNAIGAEAHENAKGLEKVINENAEEINEGI